MALKASPSIANYKNKNLMITILVVYTKCKCVQIEHINNLGGYKTLIWECVKSNLEPQNINILAELPVWGTNRKL